jgi:branched-chain amino acid transport system substrate-binding protein
MLGAACGGDDSDEGAADTAAASDEPIVVGAVIGKTGFLKPYDGPALQAFKLRVDELNAEGGVNGRKVEFIEADTKSDQAIGASLAKGLISRGAEVMVVTCDFDWGSAAALAAQDEGLVSISLCAGSPKFGVEGIGDKAYTPSSTASVEGAVQATFAIEEGWTKGFLLADPVNAFNQDAAAAIEGTYPKIGGDLVGKAEFQQEDTNIASQITQIKSSGAQVVFLVSHPPGGSVALRQLRAGGVDVPIIGLNSFSGRLWADAVPNANDIYATVSASVWGDDPEPKVNEVVERLTELTGSPPDTGLNINGYAAGEVFVEGLKRAEGNTDGEVLRDALNTLKDFDTVIGPVTYTPELHIQLDAPLRVIKFTNGKGAYYKTVSPKIKPSLP